MKILKTIFLIIAAFAIASVGVDNLSKPSNLAVVAGVLEIILAITILTLFVVLPIFKKI